MNSKHSNRDIVASAGIADATPIDTFFNMQGESTFLTLDDLTAETIANDEVQYVHPNGGLVRLGKESF